jgi:hypothetical protein
MGWVVGDDSIERIAIAADDIAWCEERSTPLLGFACLALRNCFPGLLCRRANKREHVGFLALRNLLAQRLWLRLIDQVGLLPRLAEEIVGPAGL